MKYVIRFEITSWSANHNHGRHTVMWQKDIRKLHLSYPCSRDEFINDCEAIAIHYFEEHNVFDLDYEEFDFIYNFKLLQIFDCGIEKQLMQYYMYESDIAAEI